ncbi:MAG: tetratricopeptide repeat-containing protein [Bacteroidales bacterium]|nr:tetratricopeptide repeat-containing protein [Bacteroidales bacterium]
MKTKGLKTIFAVLGILFISFQLYSQEGETSSDWKTDDTCLKNLSLYYEFYKHKNYEDAIGPWRIVFNYCPDSKESLYAYGVNIYKYFTGKEKDPVRISAYVDTIMMIYDQRIVYFPKNKGDVLGRKGIDFLRYRRLEGSEAIKEGYKILSESVEIEGLKSSEVVLTTQISAAISLFINNELDGELLINDYIAASNIIDSQIAKRPSSRTKKAKDAIDKNIKDSKVMTCESITKIFGPEFEAKKDDIKYLKLMSGFMNDAGNCELDIFYSQVSEQLYKIEPSAEAAYNLGRLFLRKEEYKKSKSYYLEAIELAASNEDKANYYYNLAGLSQTYLKSPADAARYAFEAVLLKPSWGDPYILIGKSYINGNSSLGDEFERRTAYWVAVDMFKKAKAVDPGISSKASGLITEFEAYFPTKEDLFFRSIAEGDKYTVGGWINKTTFARPKN